MAFVVDVFARCIVGWRASNTMTTDFVLDALGQALYDPQPNPEDAPMRHSDRGSQYVSIRYSARLAEACIAPSVDSRSDSYDAALARIFHQGGLWRRYTLYARTEPQNWT